MTYTEHKLTDAMLQRLSKTCHGRRAGGMSMVALEARGLIKMGDLHQRWVATEAGIAALKQARREGW